MVHKTPYALLEQLEHELDRESQAQGYTDTHPWKGILFSVSHQRFVAPIEDVVEIMPLPPMVIIPGVEPWVKGVMQIRGELILINDLGFFLYGMATKIDKGARVVIIASQGEKIGFLLSKIHTMLFLQSISLVFKDNDESQLSYAPKQLVIEEEEIPLIEFHKLIELPSFLQVSRMAR